MKPKKRLFRNQTNYDYGLSKNKCNFMKNQELVKRIRDKARKELIEEFKKMLDIFQLNKMWWSNEINDWYVHAEDWAEFKQQLQKLKEKEKK